MTTALRSLVPLIALSPLLLGGCAKPAPPTPESDAGKSAADLRAGVEQVAAEQLKQVIANYDAVIAAAKTKISDIEEKLRRMEPGAVLGGAGTRLTEELERLRDDLRGHERNRKVYSDALEAKN